MARPKTEYVNLVKSQLTDRAYEGVCRWKEMHLVTESRAIADLLELIVNGTNGTMPSTLISVTSNQPVIGTETHYAKS